MSTREAGALLVAAAIAAGAEAAEVVVRPGKRHKYALLITLPGGRRLRIPVSNKNGKGRGWRNGRNARAEIRREVRQAMEEVI